MKKNRFSVTGYFRELFRDRKRRKAFLVGLIVFVVVFAGLTAYQRSIEKKQGDVIVTGSGNSPAQENPGAEGAAADGDDSSAIGEKTGSAAESADIAGVDEDRQGDAKQEPAAIFVDVGGAVRISGLFALPHGSRVADAIEAAGGLTEDADVKYLNRAAVLSDSDRLYIPTEAEIRDGTAPPSAGQVAASGGYASGAASGGPETATGGTGPGLVNINTAGSEELQKLNGVGPATAQKIIDYRTKKGGFGRIEEIMNVSGIGAKTFEKLRACITV